MKNGVYEATEKGTPQGRRKNSSSISKYGAGKGEHCSGDLLTAVGVFLWRKSIDF